MTYEEYCKNNSEQIHQEADEFNRWRRKSTHQLLTDIGPRIAKLCQTGYQGCGFHYGMEQQFGKLIVSLSLPWQPGGNRVGDYHDIKEKMVDNILTKVLFEGLITNVEEAEKNP